MTSGSLSPLGLQKAMPVKAELPCRLRIAQSLDHVGDPPLRLDIDAALQREVDPIQRVEIGNAEDGHQLIADAVGRFPLQMRLRAGLDQLIEKAKVDAERRFTEIVLDDAFLHQKTKMLIGESFEIAASFEQIVGRAALGDQERQDLLIGAGLAKEAVSAVDIARQQIIDLAKIGAEPGKQAIADAVDLPESAPRAERRAVDIIESDLPASNCRISPLAIGRESSLRASGEAFPWHPASAHRANDETFRSGSPRCCRRPRFGWDR